MVSHLYRRWSERNARAMGSALNAQAVAGRVVAWSKFVRYTQQSLALGGGALLVIQGELSPGAMIAANVLTTRALAPIDLMVGTWSSFLSAKEAYVRLRDLLEAHPLPQSAGEVLLDGQPILNWDRMELGPHIGYLPQDVELFDGTIAENIARAGQVVSEKVIAAAEASGLHQMILRFPKGYDTPMGEAGGLLSGGQRQRIGLARALYGEPALLVLDEPNANLDDEGENALLRAVQGLKAKGKTVVLISHRPGIVSVADRLLILHQGTVQASGPRDGVLAALQQQRESIQAAQVASTSSAQAAPSDPADARDGKPSSNS